MIYSMFWVQSFLCVLKSCAVLCIHMCCINVELKACKSIPNHKEGTMDIGHQDGDNELQLDRYPRREGGVRGVWGTEDHMQVLGTPTSKVMCWVLKVETQQPQVARKQPNHLGGQLGHTLWERTWWKLDGAGTQPPMWKGCTWMVLMGEKMWDHESSPPKVPKEACTLLQPTLIASSNFFLHECSLNV